MYTNNFQTTAPEDILPVEPEFVLASRTRRWVAAFIDFGIVFALFGIVVYQYGTPERDLDGSVSYKLYGAPAFFAVFTPWFLLLPLMEAVTRGRTLGKYLFRLRSVNQDGSRISAGTGFLRHALDFIDFAPILGLVGLMAAANSKTKQRVGDKAGRTIVVQE